MKKRLLLPAAVCLAVAAVALAGEFAGVRMPDTDSIEGKTVKLNGMGLRKKMMFKVYVAGLYVENPSRDAAALISADEVKGMRLSMLRTLAGTKITEAIDEGFERNSKAQKDALRGRLAKLDAMFPDVAEGDDIWLIYLPGKGTAVKVKGAEKGVIEGKDFADALFAVWLGPNPVQDDLKKALLGG